MSSPRAAYAGRKIDISRLPGLGVRAPDLPLVRIVVEAVDIVVEVGDQSVTGNGCAFRAAAELRGIVWWRGRTDTFCWRRRRLGLGPQFPVDVRMQGVDHGEPRVALVPIGRQVDGDLSRLRVELGDLRLPHHRFPDVSILIHRDHEAAGRKAGLRHGNRIARDLAGLGVQLRDELVLEIGEPDVALFVEERVMGRGVVGQIIGRDDGLSRFAGRPGLRFQFDRATSLRS